MATIAVLPGDGIGPEVTRAAERVLKTVRPDLECVEAPVGGAALRSSASALPDEVMELCRRSKAILFGAVGLPEYEGKTLRERPEYALFLLRGGFELFANIRPVRVFSGLESASSLRPELVRGLDLVVVRELTGGIYFGKPKEQRTGADGVEEAVDTMVYRAPEIDRIARVAFTLARGRRKKLVSVDKQNILETSRLWRRVVETVAREFPDVELSHLLVDNAAMQLVRRPADFDVILTENMFGDILSDEAAILTGSIGNLPSASLGAGNFGLYEPISGSAPDIAGQGIANPTAAILSAAMLLRYSLSDEANAARIERAVEQTFGAGVRTRELAQAGQSGVTTEQFTAEVVGRL
ncbi:MAG TPA: 3-isopropylmalate dehydrogenase [Candidatus Baltobacteraceae bacterium]|jgi:3-isopropylmalate dehydrogenase|nr:3-isopropylmalate dehydrogenase [Candidatus Baltobacteraceae bacterium]